MSCKYCFPPYKDLLNVELGEDEEGCAVYYHVNCDGQNLRGYDDFCTAICFIEINYCPVCGRRLDDVNE